MAQLRITEIFYSLQGESNSVGLPTVFVRLTGCPLRCGYCDTSYAFKGGEWLALERVLAQVACLELLTALCDAGYRVSLETSGALDISRVDPRVVNVMDLKTPGSGEAEKNLFSNIERLKPADQVKFVICDAGDYAWACEQLRRWDLNNRCEVLFSPALGLQDARQLAEWILRDRLNVRFQIQLHKYLWGDVAGK
jgi:7-carboxy-7-deazaguanine synthase